MLLDLCEMSNISIAYLQLTTDTLNLILTENMEADAGQLHQILEA
jgi:hypothetical protein